MLYASFRLFVISCLPRTLARCEHQTAPAIARTASSTLWPVVQSAVAPPSGGRLEPTITPADEPGFHCQAVSVQSKEALSNRRGAMDAEADHSQPPENLSLQGGWFGRPLPRSFLRGHRAPAVPLHALRADRHGQAARHCNESHSTSVYMKGQVFFRNGSGQPGG